MKTTLLPRALVTLAVFALSALAQFDAGGFATGLRARFGAPLERKVFTTPAGEMVVDYAVSGHVCRIQLPGVGPETGRPGVSSPRGIDEFLLGLLPLSMRGKELGIMGVATGAPSVRLTRYENVTVSEGFQDIRRMEVTVTFANEACRD